MFDLEVGIVDLDSDLNIPGTGEGALDWMGVAHLLDVAGADETLTSLAGRRPMLDVEAVRLFAVQNITPFERSVIDRLRLQVEPLDDVANDPDAVAERTRAWAASYDRILVHTLAGVLMMFGVITNLGAGRVLNVRPLLFLGRLSFPIYLFHFPLLCSLGCGLFLALREVTSYAGSTIIVAIIYVVAVLMTGVLLTRVDEMWGTWLNRMTDSLVMRDTRIAPRS